MINLISGALTVLFGLFLVSLPVWCMLNRNMAVKFLNSFAGSAKAHYTEQGCRVMAGLGIALYADRMLFSGVFLFFGWMLIVSSVMLIILPWRWHNKFGQRALPFVTRYLILYVTAAAAFGLAVIYCAVVPLLRQ